MEYSTVLEDWQRDVLTIIRNELFISAAAGDEDHEGRLGFVSLKCLGYRS